MAQLERAEPSGFLVAMLCERSGQNGQSFHSITGDGCTVRLSSRVSSRQKRRAYSDSYGHMLNMLRYIRKYSYIREYDEN